MCNALTISPHYIIGVQQQGMWQGGSHKDPCTCSVRCRGRVLLMEDKEAYIAFTGVFQAV